MMKKMWVLFCALVLLTGCNADDSILSFSEIEVIPDSLNPLINSDENLQLIFEGEKTAYIVYQSTGDVLSEIEEQGETLKVMLDEEKSINVPKAQHVYKLTLDDVHEVIDIYINGNSIPFDSVSNINKEM